MSGLKRKMLKCGTACVIILLASVASPLAAGREATETETITVKIAFAGDCTIGADLRYGENGSFIDVFSKLGAEEKYSYFFEKVKPIFDNSDLAVVNLEGVLTDETKYEEKKYVFRGPPEFVNILTSGGVGIVNLANNHTWDYGQKGYADTLACLDAAGVAYFGANKPYIAEVEGVYIAFLGYVSWDTGAKSRIASDIAAVKSDGADIVVVSFHWGDERVYYPNEVQRTLGRFSIDSGADLVIGHHPHVMQGIELYSGKYIVYSLGNFCFGGNRNPPDKDTFIFEQVFEITTETEKTPLYCGKAYIYPCSVSSISGRNNFQPVPLEGGEAQRVAERLLEYSLAVNDSGFTFETLHNDADAPGYMLEWKANSKKVIIK